MRLDGCAQRPVADLLDIEMQMDLAENLAPHRRAIAWRHVLGGESKRRDVAGWRDHVPSL